MNLVLIYLGYSYYILYLPSVILMYNVYFILMLTTLSFQFMRVFSFSTYGPVWRISLLTLAGVLHLACPLCGLSCSPLAHLYVGTDPCTKHSGMSIEFTINHFTLIVFYQNCKKPTYTQPNIWLSKISSDDLLPRYSVVIYRKEWIF